MAVLETFDIFDRFFYVSADVQRQREKLEMSVGRFIHEDSSRKSIQVDLAENIS